MTSYEMTFANDYEATHSLVTLGLRRVDRAGFVGITYGDNGERLITIARKSGEFSYTIHEKEETR